MLYQNMKVGMKVAKRSGWIGIGETPSKRAKSSRFLEEPYYILRMAIREDEIERAKEQVKLYCVVNKNIRRLEEGASKEGSYAHCELLEPYDLVMGEKDEYIELH